MEFSPFFSGGKARCGTGVGEIGGAGWGVYPMPRRRCGKVKKARLHRRLTFLNKEEVVKSWAGYWPSIGAGISAGLTMTFLLASVS